MSRYSTVEGYLSYFRFAHSSKDKKQVVYLKDVILALSWGSRKQRNLSACKNTSYSVYYKNMKGFLIRTYFPCLSTQIAGGHRSPWWSSSPYRSDWPSPACASCDSCCEDVLYPCWKNTGGGSSSLQLALNNGFEFMFDFAMYVRMSIDCNRIFTKSYL